MMYPNDQLLSDIPFDAYCMAEGINASGLKEIMRSPAHYAHAQAHPRAQTPALKFGQLVHRAVLEPKLMPLVFQLPELNLRTNQGKQELAAWREDLPENAVEVSRDDYVQLQGVVEAARAHTMLQRFLSHSRTEQTLFWHDAAHDNVRCKARYDLVSDKTNVIADLKTCQDARHDAFSRDAYKYGYFLQCAHYLEGARVTGVANPDQFVFIAMEKTPPYAIALYTVDADSLNLGHQQRHEAMQAYTECKASNVWPGYSPKFEPLSAPPWAAWPA